MFGDFLKLHSSRHIQR